MNDNALDAHLLAGAYRRVDFAGIKPPAFFVLKCLFLLPLKDLGE
jgi:hypothetical protein